FFRLVQLKTFDHVEIQSKAPGSTEPRKAKRSHLSGLRIDQNGLTVWTDDRTIGEARGQAVRCRDIREARILNLGVPIKIDDAVVDSRHLARIPRKLADDVWLSADRTDRRDS